MTRRLGWTMLVTAGMVLGCALSSYDSTDAAPPTVQSVGAGPRDDDVVEQLREIRAQVTQINTLLHSGTVKVVVVLNPDN